VAYNLSKSGSPGIMFSLEMYIEQLERIYDSRGANLSYTKIKKGLLTGEEEDKYFAFLQEVGTEKPPLYLVDYSGSCTLSFIQTIVREIRKKHKIEWICIDYLTLMEPEGKYTASHEKYTTLARELKQFAKSEDLAVFTASQATRGTDKAKKVGTENVSFSDGITHNCDLIVYLSQSDEQELSNTLQMGVVKYNSKRKH
jgi:replicative DNA helicase